MYSQKKKKLREKINGFILYHDNISILSVADSVTSRVLKYYIILFNNNNNNNI